MKWLYTLVAVIALSACSSQKYSNRKYQQNNNTDDAYFSPSDLKKSSRKTAVKAQKERNEAVVGTYYDNTLDETANPNAANRNSADYTQYAPATGTNQNVGAPVNTNVLQWQQPQRQTLNMFHQPNWGMGFNCSPFAASPFMGSGFGFNQWNNGWYMGPMNNFGPGWAYNPWYGNIYNPWAFNQPWGWNSPHFHNNWNYGWNANPWAYDPWQQTWVYNPWGWNNGFYNNWYDPWNDPWNNNRWGNNGLQQVNNVRNTRRSPTNTFMPAVRTPANTQQGGGSTLMGSTERIEPPSTRNAPTGQSTTPTVNTTRGSEPTTTPNRSQPNYRTYTSENNATTPGTTLPNSNAGSSAPVTPPTRNNTNTEPTQINPNSNGGSFPTNNTFPTNNNSPSNSNYTPQNTNPSPSFSPSNNPAPSRGPAPGSGGGGGGGGGRRR